MEHEVFVPFPVETVRQALAEPDRVARCVPGLQQDADDASGPVAGRLRLRIGGSTITYRGSLRVSEQDGGDFAVEGQGVEARGGGSVKIALTLRPAATDAGTVVGCSGTEISEGRLAEADAEVAASTGRRLLDRFAAALTADLRESPTGTPAADSVAVVEIIEPGPGEDEPVESSAPDTGRSDDDEPVIPGIPAPDTASVFETEIPPPSLDPLADDPLADEGLSGDERPADEGLSGDERLADEGSGDERPADGLAEEGLTDDGLTDDLVDEPPAEAAHARRTMIGRSAEEVDHAPPRGRYAPVPAPATTSTTATLRWAAPAAAAVLASAVVVGRVLRRRR
ncbi:SRPBCC domain-containing protein [Streptomyces sp. H27-D2]|uniref:SRPBCC domain-containing protein n=1 Tax=Streptomyces sp. H27-D2 TaxID=3046304 RepID=UPI002DBF4ADF|nr:SRPBCC domain-containing protein [Streptomyces sp. H27-D2]MEC4016428.1 SRPBCC domain-containing protein [Streptomyces sp. H27-D2]